MSERYHQIVGVLLAGGVQARVVHNEAYTGISVKDTANARRIVWTDIEGLWGWTMVDMAEGTTLTGRIDLDGETRPEDVAIAIATYSYDEVPA